jgi:hypothetical protein
LSFNQGGVPAWGYARPASSLHNRDRTRTRFWKTNTVLFVILVVLSIDLGTSVTATHLRQDCTWQSGSRSQFLRQTPRHGVAPELPQDNTHTQTHNSPLSECIAECEIGNLIGKERIATVESTPPKMKLILLVCTCRTAETASQHAHDAPVMCRSSMLSECPICPRSNYNPNAAHAKSFLKK